MTELLVVGLLAGLAAGMSTVAAICVKWAVAATGPLSASVVQFILAMMAAMFLGVIVYFAAGGAKGVAAALWVASGVMSASATVVFVGFLREIRLHADGLVPGVPRAGGTPFVASVIALVVANEFLMGWSFSLITHTLPVSLGVGDHRLLAIATGAVVSRWFVFPMAFEMLLTLGLFLARFPPLMRRLLALQPAVMICSPPTLRGVPWLLGSTLGASGLMALAVAWILVALVREEAISTPAARYLLLLVLSFGLMAGGLYVWIELSNAGVFALALIAQMIVFLWAALGPDRFGLAAARGDHQYPSPGEGRAREGPEAPSSSFLRNL